MNKIISVALLVVTLVITLNALWQLYNYPVDNLYTFLTQMSILGLVVIGQMLLVAFGGLFSLFFLYWIVKWVRTGT